MYFVCECGKKFRDLVTDAREHVATKHPGLVDSQISLILGTPPYGHLTVTASLNSSELYELALDAITDEMMDALYDDEVEV